MSTFQHVCDSYCRDMYCPFYTEKKDKHINQLIEDVKQLQRDLDLISSIIKDILVKNSKQCACRANLVETQPNNS